VHNLPALLIDPYGPSALFTQNLKPATVDDDEYWEKKKKGCPFCNFMLSGPCSTQFKVWDICVENAKAREEPFEKVCIDFIGILMTCMDENSDYYPSMLQDGGEKEGEDAKSDASPSQSATSPDKDGNRE
jgi:hypothetical protein